MLNLYYIIYYIIKTIFLHFFKKKKKKQYLYTFVVASSRCPLSGMLGAKEIELH